MPNTTQPRTTVEQLIQMFTVMAWMGLGVVLLGVAIGTVMQGAVRAGFISGTVGVGLTMIWVGLRERKRGNKLIRARNRASQTPGGPISNRANREAALAKLVYWFTVMAWMGPGLVVLGMTVAAVMHGEARLVTIIVALVMGLGLTQSGVRMRRRGKRVLERYRARQSPGGPQSDQ